MSANIPNVVFHDGRSAPQFGLGVWQIDNSLCSGVVQAAISEGYRLIDTAAIYGNEEGVGEGIAKSGIPRESLFVTTKLWNDHHGHDSTKAAFEESLSKLQLDYVDMYMIHWPVPQENRFVEAWEMMINLRNEGLIKSLGVCNFNVDHLQRLLDKTGVLPVINQIELHPGFQQAELRQFHNEHNILTQAWSPLGLGTLWEDPTLLEIANKHKRSVAQILLRWQIEVGNLVITKSLKRDRLKENKDIFSFELSDDDLQQIAALDNSEGRLGPDPELFKTVAES